WPRDWSSDVCSSDLEGGEQGGGAVALVVVGHGSALSGLERQTRLGTVKRLDLALLVNRQHHRVGGGMHVETDDVLDLLGEGGIQIGRASCRGRGWGT